MTPDFAADPKVLARHRTVVLPYQDLAGRRRLPRDHQYVSLLGPLSGEGAEEPQDLAERGFLDLDQIHGVERDPVRHEANQEANRHHYGDQLTLHLGEADEVLDALAARGELQPGIVNLDLMCGATKGLTVLRHAVRILQPAVCPGPVMLVWNVMVRCAGRRRQDFTRDARDAALADPDLRETMAQHGWTLPLPVYEYEGPSGRTTMSTSVFWRMR